MVRPHSESEKRDEDSRVDYERIAEQRLPAESRDDLRHDSKPRQKQDVDLRMSEYPEQVLPEQNVPAGGRIEERRPESPIEHQEHESNRDRRERENQQK